MYSILSIRKARRAYSLMSMNDAKTASTFIVLSTFIALNTPASAEAQSCQQSIPVNVNKSIVVSAWDGSNQSEVMSCSEAEEFRGKLFLEHLAFLSQPQQFSAARINTEIQNAVQQLNQVRAELAALQNSQRARDLSVTLRSLKWLATKAKLLICAGTTVETGGMALVACGKDILVFLKDSKDAFTAFSQVAQAKDRAASLQQIISRMQMDIQQMNLAPMSGTATQQRYNTAFENLCAQIKKSCLP